MGARSRQRPRSRTARGYLRENKVAAFLGDLDELPVEVEHHTAEQVFGWTLDLSREHELSTFDACNLDLAQRMGLPLAALDEGLAKAAKEAWCRARGFLLTKGVA